MIVDVASTLKEAELIRAEVISTRLWHTYMRIGLGKGQQDKPAQPESLKGFIQAGVIYAMDLAQSVQDGTSQARNLDALEKVGFTMSNSF